MNHEDRITSGATLCEKHFSAKEIKTESITPEKREEMIQKIIEFFRKNSNESPSILRQDAVAAYDEYILMTTIKLVKPRKEYDTSLRRLLYKDMWGD